MTTPVPSIGRIVHYVSHGTPVQADGSQVFGSQCRAATVSEVGEDGQVGLVVLNPTGLFFHSLADGGGCGYDAGGETIGDLECPQKASHGTPFRYCSCGWAEASHAGGTWHWPERVD